MPLLGPNIGWEASQQFAEVTDFVPEQIESWFEECMASQTQSQGIAFTLVICKATHDGAYLPDL